MAKGLFWIKDSIEIFNFHYRNLEIRFLTMLQIQLVGRRPIQKVLVTVLNL